MGPPLITIGSGPHLIACGNCEDLIATLWKDPMQKLPHLEPTTRYIYIYIFWVVVSNIFIFTLILGEMIQFDDHIFQLG